MENEEENEIMVDPRDVKIRRLQAALFNISAMHCGDGHEEEETCIYCGTKWPCFTARVARKAGTRF